MTMTFNNMFRRGRKRQRYPVVPVSSESSYDAPTTSTTTTARRRRPEQQQKSVVALQKELERLRTECENLKRERFHYITQNEGLLRENQQINEENEVLRHELQEERVRNADLLASLIDANADYQEIGPVQHNLVERIEWDGRGQVGEYQLESLLGEGAFAQVLEGFKRPTDADQNETSRRSKRHRRMPWEQAICMETAEENKRKKIAIKVFNKRGKEVRLADCNTEIEVLKHYPHKNIIGFHTAFQTANNIYIAMDKADKSLRDLLKMQSTMGRCMPVQPDFAQQIVLGTLRALEHLHKRGVAHCDLSCANILISFGDRDDGVGYSPNNRIKAVTADKVRLIDFGCASTPNNPNTDSLGTPGFAAPEMAVSTNFDVMSADMWSLGSILMMCQFGYKSPIANRWRGQYEKLEDHQDPRRFFDGIQQCLREVGGMAANDEGDILLQNFLSHDLLQLKPERRASSSQALKHPWFSHVYTAK